MFFHAIAITDWWWNNLHLPLQSFTYVYDDITTFQLFEIYILSMFFRQFLVWHTVDRQICMHYCVLCCCFYWIFISFSESWKYCVPLVCQPNHFKLVCTKKCCYVWINTIVLCILQVSNRKIIHNATLLRFTKFDLHLHLFSICFFFFILILTFTKWNEHSNNEFDFHLTCRSRILVDYYVTVLCWYSKK